VDALHMQRPLEYAGRVVLALYQRLTGEALSEVDESRIAIGLRKVIEAQALALGYAEQRPAEEGMKADRDRLVKALGLVADPGAAIHPGGLIKKILGKQQFTPLHESLQGLRHLVGYLDAAFALQSPGLQGPERQDALQKQDWMRKNLAGFDGVRRGFVANGFVPKDADLVGLLPQRLQFKFLLALQEKLSSPSPMAPTTQPAPKRDIAGFKRTVQDSLKIAILLAALKADDPEVKGDTLLKPAPAGGSLAQQACERLGLNRHLFRHSPTAVSLWTGEELNLRAGKADYKDLGSLSEFVENWNPDRNTALRKAGNRVSATLTALPQVPAGEAQDAATPDPVQSVLSGQIAQSFNGLQPGGSFGIRLGLEGEMSVSPPVLPGLSVKFAGGMEAAGEVIIRQRMTGEGRGAHAWEVTITRGKTVRAGVSVTSPLDILSTGVAGAGSAASGLHFQFDDAGTCQRMVQSLLQGAGVDPLEWNAARIDQSRQSGRTGEVYLRGDVPLPETFGKAGASIRSELEVHSERIQQDRAVVEVLTRRVARIADAEVAGAKGRLDMSGERGSDLSVSRRIVLEGDQVRGDSELLIAARVVNGSVEAALRDVLPDLRKSALAELAQEIGDVDESSQVILRCRLTPVVMDEVNMHLRAVKSAQVNAKVLAHRADRDQAIALADRNDAAAKRLLQQPSSYRMDALLVRENKRASQEGLAVLGMKPTAASSETLEREISLPAEVTAGSDTASSGDGARLTDAYSQWLTMTPATTR